MPAPQQVRECYLEVRVPGSHEVVTVIELLSPWSKRPGEGRQQYEAKRQHVLATLTSLVEIDLLRGGEPLPVRFAGRQMTKLPGDYRVIAARGHERPRAELYPFSVREPIPPFPLPLRPGDEEPPVDLQAVFTTVYARGAYDLRIDYHAEPVPPLAAADVAWARELLGARGPR